MIEKVASNFPLSFKVSTTRQSDAFILETGDERGLMRKSKADTYRSLIEESVLRDSMLNPLLSGSSSATRTLFENLTQQSASARMVDSSQIAAAGSLGSTSSPLQNGTLSYDTLPVFNADSTLFYYGAPKPEDFYFVPEKLWQAVVSTPGIETAVEAFEGVPALFEMPRWEVETGVGKEPRFKRVEVDDATMLSYDYPQILAYAVDVMQRDGAGNREISALESLTENIRRVLNEPLTLSSRPSEAYYASRILVLFGVEELYAAYEKSLKDYVKWVKGTMPTDEQMRIFSIPKELEKEYTGLMADTQYEPLLTETLEARLQENTSNYNYPRKHSSAIRKVVSSHPAAGEIPETDTAVAPSVTAGTSEAAQTSAPTASEEATTTYPAIPDRPLTSREKLVFYGSFDPEHIQRAKDHPAGSRP